MQLGGKAIFCDTFDNKNPGIPSRTGDLDPNVWGVSRASGGNKWAATRVEACNGLTATLRARSHYLQRSVAPGKQ